MNQDQMNQKEEERRAPRKIYEQEHEQILTIKQTRLKIQRGKIYAEFAKWKSDFVQAEKIFEVQKAEI